MMWRRASTLAVQALGCAWLLVSGPTSAGGPEVPDLTIARDAPGLANVGGVLRYRGEPFSGHVVERAGGQLLASTPYLAGKEHGVVAAWYPDGSPRYRRIYRRGLREGTHHGFGCGSLVTT